MLFSTFRSGYRKFYYFQKYFGIDDHQQPCDSAEAREQQFRTCWFLELVNLLSRNIQLCNKSITLKWRVQQFN